MAPTKSQLDHGPDPVAPERSSLSLDGAHRRRFGAPAAVLSAVLYERFAWRGEADFADQLLSAMRKQFGGHAEITAAAG